VKPSGKFLIGIFALLLAGACALLWRGYQDAARRKSRAIAVEAERGWREAKERAEAQTQAAILLNTLEPYQKEIEHHFALERQRQFKGPMGTYLHYFNKLKYSGSSLRDRLPFMPRLPQAVAPPKEWDLSNFTQACSSVASEQHLDARSKALANHLLVAADGENFPVALLTEPTEAVAKLD